VRQQLNYSCLPVGVLLAIAMLGEWCSAQQDTSNSGLGNYPTPPPMTSPTGREQPAAPSMPMQPTTTSRPNGWPGGEASPWVPAGQRFSPADMVPRGDVKPCDGTRILARVGSEAILESDVAGFVNENLQKYAGKVSPDELEKGRELLTQKRLKEVIETKLVYQDAKHEIPTESWPHIEEDLRKEFEGESSGPLMPQTVTLEKMMKRAGANSRRELDQKLRSLGTSLEQEKRAALELNLAQKWVASQLKRDEEITLAETVGYYHQHEKDFTTPARAQWEELMVRYAKYPSRAVAYDAIARMGNQVLAGRPFADVARAGSDGLEAAQGGRRDWTVKGALVCQALDAAVFNTPVGQLSPIIEGDSGFHIIRVTRRDPEITKPFLEAQAEIKKKITNQRWEKQLRDFMAKLQGRTYVWTIFDAPAATAQTPGPDSPMRR
jgi:parvulin-like peptidyl-prolyl isomerase